MTFFGGSELAAKRLEHELVPKATVVAVVLDPDPPPRSGWWRRRRVPLAPQIVLIKLASERDLDAAFDRIVAAGVGALLRSQLQRIVALAARHAIPTIYELRDYVEAGGLISYAASFPGAYRQGGIYTGRILKATSPPISQSCSLQPSSWLSISRQQWH